MADTPVSKPTEDGKVKVHMTPYRPSYWGTPDTDILNLLRLYKKDLEAKEERYKMLQEEALERYHKSKTKTLTFLELMSQADEDFKELARKWSQAQGKDDDVKPNPDACTVPPPEEDDESKLRYRLETVEKDIDMAKFLLSLQNTGELSHVRRVLDRALGTIRRAKGD